MIREDLGDSNTLVNIMKGRIAQRRMIVYGAFGMVGACLLIAMLSWVL